MFIVLCRQELFAQNVTKQIETKEGLLAVRAGVGKDYGSCQALYLNGKKILHEQYVIPRLLEKQEYLLPGSGFGILWAG